MRSSMLRWLPVACIAVAVLAAAPPAPAQVPPSPEAGEIAHCLCLQQSMDALGAEMNHTQQAYAASQSELSQIDAQMQSERARMDVDNPQSVAQFRQLLDRRDAIARRSNDIAIGRLHELSTRFNSSVDEYNARCANHPRNPDLLRAVQATLSCPQP